MRQTYTLLKLVSNAERPLTVQMNGSRKIVHYEAPTIEIIEADTTKAKCQRTLYVISRESEYLRDLQAQRATVIGQPQGERVLMLRELAIDIITRAEYDWVRNTDWSSLWNNIDTRLNVIKGDYLIIPCIHQRI
jgi:hypothetical protein